MRFYFALMLSILLGVHAVQADELTVYEGTATNASVPIRPYYGDTDGQKSEFIISANQLADMDGGNIMKMQFKLSSSASKAWTATYEVFLKEIEQDAFEIQAGSGFYSSSTATPIGKEGATIVYSGVINPSGTDVIIDFSESFEYKGGNLLVGVYMTKKGNYEDKNFLGTQVENGSWAYVSSKNTPQNFIPQTTFTYEKAVDGPGFKVKGYKSGDNVSYGMVNPGTTQTFTLSNPGTEAVTVSITTTGGFTADNSSVTIEAKGEQTVSIAAPEETASGTVTFTPSASGLEAVTLNLNCVVKDPNKMFVDFNDNLLPEGWETVGIGKYPTGGYSGNYNWDFTKGYALYAASSSWESSLSDYYSSLVSPLVKFEDGEKLIFKAKKEATTSSYFGYVRVDYSTDGTTWTAVEGGEFKNAVLTTDWQEFEVTMPASTKKLRFVAAGIGIDDIYGGEYSLAPVMAVTAKDYTFGMISEPASTTFTIGNNGKSALTGVEVTSDNAAFTITDVPESVEPGQTATVTVTMAVDNKATAQSATITITAPEQETVTFSVNGYVIDDELFTETFDGNALPEGWAMESGSTSTDYKWTFADGAATGSSSYARLITPALTVAEGEAMAIEIKKYYTWACTLPIYVSKDGGEFTLLKTIANTDLSDSYKVFYIDGLEAGNYKIRFDGDGIVLNAVNGFHLNMNAPVMELVSTEAAAFGKVTENASKVYTVKNTGTGTLTVDITSDNEEFTVSPSQLNVEKGEPQEFTVTFNYTEGNYGKKNATITVTPTYNTEAAVTIAASAKTVDPNAWDEDFEEGKMPIGWDANNWSVATGSFTDNNTKVAKATASAATLISPRLEAKAGDVLMWEGLFDWYDEGIRVEYSNDEKATWNIVEIDGLTLGTATTGSLANAYVPRNNGYTNERGTKLDMSFVAPADGIYYLRFTSSYSGNAVDNFNGFKLALKEHDAAIADQNIRSTFTQYTNHQVSVTVKEMVGKEETLTAQFFVGDTQYGEDVTETVGAGEEKEIVIDVRFDDIVEGDAYIKVFNDNISLETEKVAVTTKAAIVLDETVAPEDLPTSGYQDKVAVRYHAKAGWNTICMPFALSDDDMTALFGEGYKVYELTSYKDGELGFKTSTRRYAGYPYIVYCEAAPTIDEIGYLVTYVQFVNGAKYDSYGGATCQGTFAPIPAPGMEGKYGVTPAGKIQKGGSKASLKGYRAYFELPSEDEGKFSIAIDGETIATGIDAIEMLNELNGNVYDLQGRKVNSAQKGVFIQNGKKVVVK